MDQRIASTLRRLEAFIQDKDDALAISREVGEFVYALLQANTLSHLKQLAPFCSWIRQHPTFVSAHVPMGNGMELSVYVRSGGAGGQ